MLTVGPLGPQYFVCMVYTYKETISKLKFFLIYNAYVEIEQEDSDNDLENETDETDSDDEQCNDCNYEGKTVAGVKMHMKSDHRIRCNICGLNTTIIALLKNNLRESHE